MSEVQSILFARRNPATGGVWWTNAKAVRWLKAHHYKTDVDVKPKHLRYRQLAPSTVKRHGKSQMRTIAIAPGIQFVIAFQRH